MSETIEEKAVLEQEPRQVQTIMVPAPTVTTSPMDMLPGEFNKGLARRKKNRDALMGWIKDALVSGVDFQRIKVRGRWSKPFLSKAGSEKVLGMLGVTPTFPNLVDQTDAISRGDSKIMILRCEVVNPQGQVVGTGAGGRSLEQDGGDINKMIKMCLKSAMIDATLRVGGLSEIFTQDEESAHDDHIIPPITPEQATSLIALAEEVGLPIQSVSKFYGVEKINQLPADKFLRAKKAIEKRRQQENQDATE